jgi:hypothetical protein
LKHLKKILNTHWHKVLLLCKIIFPHNRYEIKGWTPQWLFLMFEKCIMGKVPLSLRL